MKKPLLIFLAFLFFLPAFSSAKELPKVAVWDLTSGDIKEAYAQDLTLILASEVSKLGKYEVYSQANVRTLAGWTEERMKLGCTNTQCLTALGQMDIAKLISGRIGKIGNRYSVSLNLFDTEKARSERMISEFCRSEDELIELVQVAVRKLLGAEAAPSVPAQKVPGKTPDPLGSAREPRRVDFSKIPLKNALVMGDSNSPLKIAVFTDPECLPYCASLHQEMKKVLQVRKDVTFYILLYPLPNHKDAYWKSRSILCNRSVKMLEDAFAGKQIAKIECGTKEIDENLELARDLGLEGTPAIVFPDGRVYLGSQSARQLIGLIDK
jgi:protein-disulfide isomerase